jgi:hypothetical protein
MGQLATVANGFRNPMYLRCHYKDDACAATELGEDCRPAPGRSCSRCATNPADYGYPCCYRQGRPHPRGLQHARRLHGLRLEDASFVLSDTPFGFDWERDLWPEPYKGCGVRWPCTAASTPTRLGRRPHRASPASIR